MMSQLSLRSLRGTKKVSYACCKSIAYKIENDPSIVGLACGKSATLSSPSTLLEVPLLTGYSPTESGKLLVFRRCTPVPVLVYESPEYELNSLPKSLMYGNNHYNY
jgi:hypothetical protein